MVGETIIKLYNNYKNKLFKNISMKTSKKKKTVFFINIVIIGENNTTK